MNDIDLLINQFILEAGKLYTLPELYQQLDEKIQSDTASIDEIGELLSTDAALSAKLLRIANCPLYGFRAQINTLDRALSLIGLKEVKNIILMETVAQNFKKDDKYTAISMEDFWRRSIYIGLIAKKIASILKHPEPDRLFICGIMSRIGQLVCCATRSKEVLTIAHRQQSNPDINEFTFELEMLGFSYNQVSAALLAHWKVPEDITIPLEHVHQPLNIPNEHSDYQRDIFILYVATVYSYLIQIDEQLLTEQNESAGNQNAEFIKRIDDPINHALTIDQKMIDSILFEIEIDVMAILTAVFPDSMNIY